MKKKVLILIPAYNEEKNIAAVLNAWNASEYKNIADILVIDDGSKTELKKRQENVA